MTPLRTTAPSRTPLRRLGRTALVSATVLAVVAGLAACAPAAATPDASASASSTRTVQTAKGEVAVPATPERVVSIHSYTTESAFDLGITPVAVENSGAEYVPQRYLDRWNAAPKVTTNATVDLEAIAALKPDLIIGVDVPYLDALYPQLTAIAPTAFTTFDNGTWKDYAAQTADFVNAGAALATLKTSYDNRIQQIKTDDAAELANSTFAVIQGGFDAGNYWIYGPDSSVGAILTELGATLSTASAAVTGDNTNSVSYEQADLLSDADYIVYYTSNDGTPANDIDKLFALDSFKQLKAVTNDHLIPTADFLPGSYSDGIGVLDAVDQVLKQQ